MVRSQLRRRGGLLPQSQGTRVVAFLAASAHEHTSEASECCRPQARRQSYTGCSTSASLTPPVRVILSSSLTRDIFVLCCGRCQQHRTSPLSIVHTNSHYRHHDYAVMLKSISFPLSSLNPDVCVRHCLAPSLPSPTFERGTEGRECHLCDSVTECVYTVAFASVSPLSPSTMVTYKQHTHEFVWKLTTGGCRVTAGAPLERSEDRVLLPWTPRTTISWS